MRSTTDSNNGFSHLLLSLVGGVKTQPPYRACTLWQIRISTERCDAALYALSEHYHAHPDTLPTLRRHAVEGPSNFERASALSGLAKYFNHDQAVFELVRGQAFHDPDKFPRTVATKGLGEYFRNQQDTLQLL